MPHRLKIDDSDIEAMEQALGDVRFTDRYRNLALRCMESQDIQACPGSGKTTLLVVKLAILAQKWQWRNRGILVLSHTNVAREEVQRRLSTINQLNVLKYPHFIGTFQKFANQFLAIPHLRNSGHTNFSIDNGRYGKLAVNLLSTSSQFRKAFRFLANKPNSGGAGLASELRYEGADLKVNCAIHERPCSETSPSWKELRELKKVISTRFGVFRYDDMFAFAERHLAKNPWAAEALQYRFPWVFIDEMQDTDIIQENLLKHAFGSQCRIQRIGDLNQAIFGSMGAREMPTSFPRQGALQLPGSNRYNDAIAQIVKPLARDFKFPDLTGNDRVASKNHTIFVFTANSIHKVLPAFGALLLQEYPDGFPEKFIAKALGARRTGDDYSGEKIPYRIFDYILDFPSPAYSDSRGFSSLIECIELARNKVSTTKDFGPGWDALTDGLLEISKLGGCKDLGLPQTNRSPYYSKQRLLEVISSNGGLYALRTFAFEILSGRSELTHKDKWETFTHKLREVLEQSLSTTLELTPILTEFCNWPPANSPAMTTSQRSNLYSYIEIDPVRQVDVEIATIHSAKGETHTATLVLDTFDRAHDLKTVIPYLISETKTASQSDLKRIKRTFVAMTRPRELLCLAVRQDAIKPNQRKRLEEKWRIVDL